MVRFGAKKEEFIPPFLFYFSLKQKKRALGPLFIYGSNVLRMFSIKGTNRFPVHYIKKCIDIIWTSILIV